MTPDGPPAPPESEPSPAMQAGAAEAIALSPAALAGAGDDGVLRWANPAFCQLLHGREAALVGRAVSDCLGLDARDALALQRALDDARRDGCGTAELTRRTFGLGVAAMELRVRRAAAGGAVLALQPQGPLAAGPSDEALSHLTTAVDLAGLAIWRHDLATDQVYYNTEAYALLDMQPREGGLTLAEVREMTHPDDLEAVKSSAEAALATGQPADVEVRYRRRGGDWRSMLVRRVVQCGADGQPVAFIGVALDVTERQLEQREAAEVRRRLKAITRAAGIGYWSGGGDDRVTTWSDQLRVIHGLAADAPLPTMREWLETCTHPDDRDAIRQRYGEWKASGRATLESDFRVVRPDGQVRHVMTHTRYEPSAPMGRLFGIVIDVTERRTAGLALRQASERAALAARGAGLGTWELDLLDGSAFWDEQMWRLRGRAPQPAAPDRAAQLAMVHPDDRADVQRNLQHALQTQTPSNYEFRVVLPDGRERWLASRSSPVRDDDGRATRRIGVNWDVTDRRNAEAAQREREAAARESQAQHRFLSRMSHELRTPLNAVLGFAQLALAEGQEVDPASRRQRLGHIESAGQHLLALVNDLLDLSSLHSGELRVALAPVPLGPLAQETAALLEPLRREYGVELVVGALGAVPLADPTRLRQVLINLLTNAIKYNRPGGRVTLDAFTRQDRAFVRVADTGHGLTEAQQRHLFEPFNRLGAETSGVEGTGIGLSIVKVLAERMGGSLRLSSQIGVGSTFELELADSAEQITLAAPAAAPAAPASPRGTLLYVEDNPVNALIIAELVARRPDLRLHVAEDGASGVRQALALRPDLVLLDMQLPDIDGLEVLRRLRARPETAEIPVIALSANAMPGDIQRALQAGLSDYWTKPLDFRAFMTSLDAIFGRA